MFLRLIATAFLVAFDGLVSRELWRLTMIASIAPMRLVMALIASIAIGPLQLVMPSLPVVACRNWPSSNTCVVFASMEFNSLIN